MHTVNTSVKKKDSKALVTGKPVFTDDIAPKDCLIVKVLRSPHAHALIRRIDTEKAKKVDGIACILTYLDVPNRRFTMAGQTYPEPSPYDRLILEDRMRFVGDAAAIVAGETEEAVDHALRLIKVDYEVLKPVLDFRKAKDHTVLIHPEENWESLCPVGADNHRNLCASGGESHGDVDGLLNQCDYVVDRVYHTKANQQAMMETFRAYSYLDAYGRLNMVASTQVTFHVRRILAHALDIPKSRVRVIKPRIGGGFGAKQTVVAEVYPAIVTMKTGRAAKIIYSRYESQIASSPRHEMEIRVRVGADKNGILQAMDVYTLSNTGAYGEHGPTTVGLSGHKSIPLYRTPKAFRFAYDVVYTNCMSAGAYRGYGATQGQFAVESAINELAEKIGMDKVKIRELNMVREGDIMPAYYGETLKSCALDRCMARAKEMMDWDKKYPAIDMGNGKVRGVGVAMAMQGSAISGVDVASVELRLNDDGFYTLMIGASDMGTGCDTTLAQVAADCLECDLDQIVVHGTDTDVSPYDSGSYASSTMYLTGMAVMKACGEMRDKILDKGAEYLSCDKNSLEFDGTRVWQPESGLEVSLKDIGNKVMCFNEKMLSAGASHTSPVSPPPFMVGMAEVEVDIETGEAELLDYVAVVDCGTTINPNLARIQTEGGIAQGIGMALCEDITYTEKGQMKQNSFMQYKLPTRLDVGNIRVEFESSYEPTGPFGAKSIGEIVINTPSPAIADAIANAAGARVRELPITAEKIYRSKNKK
ncbi:molybdopterin cofactor-binding domain-containing protein [Clostridium boliviensis]|uniref:Molybdopterin cofactor-binding domain-containing protein n=1 Tax=Clostridium boliviensis TaxID=318465 RepID=A0ABU4GMR1_9CLOT|nr:molybdopterin cofactor-binding domain-containing protein [Clostridium boliviensis]MDW2798238.1 molybdopterin cofactor-binding domain-containing protein [Clostridium boliviensis]